MMKPPLIILSGATAVGKTDLSIRLAKTIGGEILSADSMQVYKGFDIGTAKIRKDEMQNVPHYLIDELEPDEEFSVFEFQKRALSYIHSIHEKGRIPILAGGTGFYIQSVLYEIEFTSSETDIAYRRELEQMAKEKGPQALHRLLEEADPEAAGQIHANNVKRTIRALEYYRETGQCISLHNKQQRSRQPAFNAAYFVLNRNRAVIYDRIDQRVDAMLQQGLVQEVRSLIERGVSPDSLAMQGLGYKEIVRYLNHELTYEEAADLIKKSTRHFAKRQITWFRREQDVIWMNYEEYPSEEEMLSKMIDILKEKNIVPLS